MLGIATDKTGLSGHAWVLSVSFALQLLSCALHIQNNGNCSPCHFEVRCSHREISFQHCGISRFATQKLGVRGMHFNASGRRWIARYEQMRASFWGRTHCRAVCILEMTRWLS